TLLSLAASLRGRRLGGHEEEARRPGGAGLAVRPTRALEAHPDLARQLVLEGAIDAEPPRGRVEPQHVDAMVAVLAVAGDVPRVVGDGAMRAVGPPGGDVGSAPA